MLTIILSTLAAQVFSAPAAAIVEYHGKFRLDFTPTGYGSSVVAQKANWRLTTLSGGLSSCAFELADFGVSGVEISGSCGNNLLSGNVVPFDANGVLVNGTQTAVTASSTDGSFAPVAVKVICQDGVNGRQLCSGFW